MNPKCIEIMQTASQRPIIKQTACLFVTDNTVIQWHWTAREELNCKNDRNFPWHFRRKRIMTINRHVFRKISRCSLAIMQSCFSLFFWLYQFICGPNNQNKPDPVENHWFEGKSQSLWLSDESFEVANHISFVCSLSSLRFPPYAFLPTLSSLRFPPYAFLLTLSSLLTVIFNSQQAIEQIR